MKNLTLLLFFVCTAFAAGAQEVSFGAKGGLNIAKVTSTDNSKTRASIHLGAFARIGITEEWSVQPELVYSGQGYKWNPPVLDRMNFAVNYINLPVMLQYHIIPEFHLEAGPQIGFRVAAKAKFTNGDALDIKDETKGVDLGLGFGLGYTFDMGLGVGARYNFGLTNIWDNNRDSGNNSVAQIGVYYIIGKKKF
ncbi:porin family protein [Chitinophaga barathri]|uniref:PorT family protein n=1 Tax=Chitinophaga barathri TaxID=1647451 RepID=A0A3N4MRM7_9BACT|nr:porin family protein [Chitinophaga barathri]RPD42229.1 PorT family protein [Chitinophaga barathri]